MAAGRRLCLVGGLVGAFALASPVAALAVDTYVDQGTGLDAQNNCQDLTNPCKTIIHGLNRAGTDGTVHVEGGHTYTASIVLGDGKSLIHDDFVAGEPGGDAVLDNSSVSIGSDITVTTDAGKIKGFTIRATHAAIDAQAKVTINGNDFDSATEPFGVDLSGTGAIKVRRNRFTSGNTETQQAILTSATGKVTIAHNTIAGYDEPIFVAAGAPSITANDISGVRQVSSGPIAISVNTGASADITRNTIHSPVPGGTFTIAVFANGADAMTLSRNLITDFDIGVQLSDTAHAASLSDDAILNTAYYALISSDSGTDDPGEIGDVVATNETWAPATGVTPASIEQAHLSLDSSILTQGGIGAFGGATCTITFSAGPFSFPGGNGCLDFQLTADPKLKGDGYHLRSASPMIDAGNPADPGGAKDIDGDARALDGPDNASCSEAGTRDIGADEFVC